MTTLRLLVIGSAICFGSAGCTTIGTPIIAGAVDTVGIAVAAGPAEQTGAALTVGYKGAKFAIVPVQNANGDQLSLHDGPDKEKGFSVLAILGLDAKGALAATEVGIEQVVAVGPAAEMWAAERAKMPPWTPTKPAP